MSEAVGQQTPPGVAIDTAPDGTVERFRHGKTVAIVIRLLAERSGGAERIYVELANMLAARGYEVTCLHYDQSRGKPFFPLDPRIELINLHPDPVPFGYRLRRWASRRPFFPASLRQKWGWAAANDIFVAQLRDYFTLRRPDVVLTFMPPANTPALLAAAGTGVKVIPTNHNVPEEDYTSPERWDPNPIDREVRLAALDHAARIHVIFPRFGDWFPSHLQSRIVAMPNYVSEEILEARPAPQREPIILAVGRLAKVKNYATLLDAWALIARDHPQWKVVIYGVGPQLKVLKAEAQRLGVEDSFILAGHRGNLGEEYARMSIFCHPAHFEGFGLSPAEALALGMPVVAFADCPGVNEFVFDGENGLMVDRAGGPAALAAALRRLIEDEALRRRLGDAGPASVASFTQEQYAERWIALIEELTDPAKAHGDA
ncbi:MAG: glycosyltransferase [Rhizobiales bacterium]|nr:glycosyltransferase [Hyphomicrobiales bacterium]